MGHPIPELWLFQNLTLKIKGQGHRWGHSSKSQCASNILSTHIPFVPCQSGIPFLSYDYFKIWPWKSRVKVMGEVTVQSHNVGETSNRLTSLSFHGHRASHSWVTTFHGEVTLQSHKVGLTSYRLTYLSFHVNRASHSWVTSISKFDIENQGSIDGHGRGHSSKSQCGSNRVLANPKFLPTDIDLCVSRIRRTDRRPPSPKKCHYIYITYIC